MVSTPPPNTPIPIPIEEDPEKVDQLVPFTPEMKLLATVRLLVAVPVPIVIPRPPYPPEFVALTFITLFPAMAEEVKPVSIEIPTGCED